MLVLFSAVLSAVTQHGPPDRRIISERLAIRFAAGSSRGI